MWLICFCLSNIVQNLLKLTYEMIYDIAELVKGEMVLSSFTTVDGHDKSLCLIPCSIICEVCFLEYNISLENLDLAVDIVR